MVHASRWILVATGFLLVLSTEVANANQWPEYRGPGGAGSVPGTLPLQWNETTHVKWKTPLHGKAWSSPVVWDKQIWLTTATPEGKQLGVICVNADSGKIEHDLKVFDNPFPQFCIERNSYASSTPVIEDKRIYVHYGAHGTACLDTSTGKTLWTRRDLPCYHHRGPASSPILFEDLLILTFDGFDLQYMVALDKFSGATVWKRDRNIEYGSDDGDTKKAYATPTLVKVGESHQLVSPSAWASMAYDPRTGDELWRVKCGGMNVSARPVQGLGLVFLTTADGGFVQYAVRPDGKGDVTGTHVVWKNTKGVPKHSSPIFVDGLLFMASEQGIMSCLDAATGKIVWQKRVGGSFTASPIHSAGRIYFFSETGEAHVIAASRQFESLATNQLSQGCMASPAATGNALLVRTIDSLYRIE